MVNSTIDAKSSEISALNFSNLIRGPDPLMTCLDCGKGYFSFAAKQVEEVLTLCWAVAEN